MPTRERVQGLIDAAVTGAHAEAIARFHEIAMQIWDGDKIARERFCHDSPAAAWRAPG